MHDEDPLLDRARIPEPQDALQILRAEEVEADAVLVVRDQLLQPRKGALIQDLAAQDPLCRMQVHQRVSKMAYMGTGQKALSGK